MINTHAQDLRKILSENKFLTLPGVYDCLSAKIAEEVGFPAARWPTACWAAPISAF